MYNGVLTVLWGNFDSAGSRLFSAGSALWKQSARQADNSIIFSILLGHLSVSNSFGTYDRKFGTKVLLPPENCGAGLVFPFRISLRDFFSLILLFFYPHENNEKCRFRWHNSYLTKHMFSAHRAITMHGRNPPGAATSPEKPDFFKSHWRSLFSSFKIVMSEIKSGR